MDRKHLLLNILGNLGAAGIVMDLWGSFILFACHTDKFRRAGQDSLLATDLRKVEAIKREMREMTYRSHLQKAQGLVCTVCPEPAISTRNNLAGAEARYTQYF